MKEELQRILELFSVERILCNATDRQRQAIRARQNADIHRKLYVVTTVFIFVQLFFIISDLITDFYGRIPYSWLNLTAEIVIIVASCVTILFLVMLRDQKESDKVRAVQLGYYLALETGFLCYLLSDLLRDLTNIYNVYYNMVILAIFAVYSFRNVVILTAYISLGTVLSLLLMPDRFAWETFQLLPLFLMLFFFCANFFRAENTKRFFTDVKSQELANELEILSTQDFLTKLPNRTALNQFILGQLEAAAREKRQVALMMIDIDDFKAFNDFHSHLEGDACLQKVGQALLAVRSDKFHVFRYGGEEFLFIGVDIDERELICFAASVHRQLERMKIPRGDGLNAQGYITVSIGCSLARLSRMGGYHDLLRAADRALYSAKRMGKNCSVYKDRIC